MTDMNESQDKSSNYELKSDAVEKLLDAQEGRVEDYSQEELDKYRSKKLGIPQWLKMVALKAWFAGAVCFFFLFGLSSYLPGQLDLLFVAGAALGMATDLLTNNVIRFLEKTPGGNDRWLLVTKKGVVGLGLNLLAAFVILFLVYSTYAVCNYVIISITGATDTVPLGVEPVLFGLLCMAYEMLLIGLKRMLQSILRDAKDAARNHQT